MIYLSPPLSAMWEYSEKAAVYKPGSRPLPNTRSPSALILHFPDPELWEQMFVV